MSSKSNLTKEEPGREGLRGLDVCRDQREFIANFLRVLQDEAGKLRFQSPQHLTERTLKLQVSMIGGAPSAASVEELYRRVRDRLGCPAAHPSNSSATLGQMAIFYFNRLPS